VASHESEAQQLALVQSAPTATQPLDATQCLVASHDRPAQHARLVQSALAAAQAPPSEFAPAALPQPAARSVIKRA
jgi:hypothetical protein